MTAVDEFTWLHHAESGGYFRCPTEAVEGWRENGWEPCEPPAEQNPATAEWQPLTAPTASGEPESAAPKTRTSRRGESVEG